VPDEAVLTQFHDFILEQGFKFTEAEFAQDHAWIKQTLQREMYITAFSIDESRHVAIETDPMVEKAIDAMPKAKALLDNARKIVAQRMAK
jgi:carboxyl-terminal processing protease